MIRVPTRVKNSTDGVKSTGISRSVTELSEHLVRVFKSQQVSTTTNHSTALHLYQTRLSYELNLLWSLFHKIWLNSWELKETPFSFSPALPTVPFFLSVAVLSISSFFFQYSESVSLLIQTGKSYYSHHSKIKTNTHHKCPSWKAFSS